MKALSEAEADALELPRTTQWDGGARRSGPRTGAERQRAMRERHARDRAALIAKIKYFHDEHALFRKRTGTAFEDFMALRNLPNMINALQRNSR